MDCNISPCGTIDADELTGELCLCLNGFVDSTGLTYKVWIKSTYNDARMMRLSIV